MKGLSPVTKAEAMQELIYQLFREYLREPPTGDHIRTPKEYYKKMTNPGAPDMALAYYVAFSNGVIKGLELAGMIADQPIKERSRTNAAKMVL